MFTLLADSEFIAYYGTFTEAVFRANLESEKQPTTLYSVFSPFGETGRIYQVQGRKCLHIDPFWGGLLGRGQTLMPTPR